MDKCMIADAIPIPNAKALIDGIASLHKADIPPNLMKKGATKRGAEFDPNSYFKVLKHISITPDHILDYVYNLQSIGGEPILYVRRNDAVPFQYPGQVSSWNRRHDICDSILADGTPQSFFELVVFHHMAGRFYQFWHACYNDLSILTSQSEIETIISNVSKSGSARAFTDAETTKLRSFELQPLVKFTDQSASIFYYTFTSWGGLAWEKKTYSRKAPHRLSGKMTMGRVKYDCGVVF